MFAPLMRGRALIAGAALLSGSGVAVASCSALHTSPEKNWRTELSYKSQYRGQVMCDSHVPHPNVTSHAFACLLAVQLGPPVPSKEQIMAGETPCGPVVRHGCCLAQLGPFGGLWLRVGLPQAPSRADGASLADAISTLPASERAATYVCIGERSISPDLTETLLERGFAFHHYRQSPPDGVGDTPEHNEFVYYRFEGDAAHDMVPAYATATEGVGGVILSPDETQVLLIWEYGCWKMVTGSVDPGEALLATLRREAREEVGVQIDGEYDPRYLGGWHMARMRDHLINDRFSMFAVRAASTEFAVDGIEVSAAQWFDRRALLRLWEESAGGTVATDQHRIELPGLSDPSERNVVSTWALRSLRSLEEGQGMLVKPAGDRAVFFIPPGTS